MRFAFRVQGFALERSPWMGAQEPKSFIQSSD